MHGSIDFEVQRVTKSMQNRSPRSMGSRSGSQDGSPAATWDLGSQILETFIKSQGLRPKIPGGGEAPVGAEGRAGRCWVVLVGAGRCWVVLVGAGSCWYVLGRGAPRAPLLSDSPPLPSMLRSNEPYLPHADDPTGTVGRRILIET